MAARKVPLTKSGKPDKRFVKTTGAKSKRTKKTPSKRLVKRRAKKQVKGYSANPVTDHVIKIVAKNGVTGFFGGQTARGAQVVKSAAKAKKLSKAAASEVAKVLRSVYAKTVREVRAIKK